MKQLHFTGRSHWEGGKLVANIKADFGYLLMYSGNTRLFQEIKITAKGYDDLMYHTNKLVAYRDYGQGGNTEVQLTNEKKLNDWLKKHKYDKIES